MASKREIIRLNSENGDGDFITMTKNKKEHPEKMVVKKYNRKARRHMLYKEGKIK